MKSMVFCLYLVILQIISTASKKGNEFFTSAADMEILLKVEHKLAKKFLKFVESEEERLNKLEAHISSIEKKVPRTNLDKYEMFVSHVTNAHGILVRFTKFWKNFRKFTIQKDSRDNINSLTSDLVRIKLAYPSEEDLIGALQAINRLQETYKIHPATFIDGLNLISHKLTVEETFEIGYLCLQVHEYKYGHMWLKETLYRLPPNQNKIGFVERIMVLEHLAWCEYSIGMLEAAIKHTKAILQAEPGNAAARVNLELYQSDYLKSKTDPTVRKNFTKPKQPWANHLYKLCKGEEKMAQKDIDKLYCRYESHHPRFILKPLKMEVLYDNPYIVLYYDLISDSQIEHIKKKAKPVLRRAFVHNINTGRLEYADYRVSKNTWISEDMDEVAAEIIKKVGDVTGLNMRYAEYLQVANYGIAGQYEPHFDHATKAKPKDFENWGGNRIATMLMYMSDVEWGGRTVFTNTGPGVGTDPVKGAGVFWYNLKRNGKSNEKTQHAGCPVVLGQKWVSNLWIHEHGQEFRYPCSLNPSE